LLNKLINEIKAIKEELQKINGNVETICMYVMGTEK